MSTVAELIAQLGALVATAVADTDGDGLPTLAGTAEPGSTVRVTDPSGTEHAIAVDGNGNFSLELSVAPSPLTGNYVARATDAASNTSPVGTFTFTATDLTAPNAPTLALGAGVANGATAADVGAAAITMLAELHGEGGISRFGDTHVNPQNGQTYPVYRLPKRETLILVSGYNLAMRARIIDRWQELVSVATQPAHLIPQNLPEALRLAADLAQFVNTPKGHRPMAAVAIMG